MHPYKIIRSASICIMVMLTGCVSQRDACYDEEVLPVHNECEVFTIVNGISTNSDPQKRENLANAALMYCLIEIERIKKCEAKSNILPGTIGP